MTAAIHADDAVGVETPHWYIAIVGNRSEHRSSETLLASGYETFVASQREKHVWKNGRSKEVDRIVLPSLVFVHTTESERKKHVAFFPCIKRFLTDPSRRKEPGAPAPAAIVPDREMDALRMMLSQSESPVSIVENPIRVGDKVRVLFGRLKGLVGTVQRSGAGRSRLFVSLDILGCASVEIDRNQVETIH
jgi:transcription antitermination factor NusG